MNKYHIFTLNQWWESSSKHGLVHDGFSPLGEQEKGTGPGKLARTNTQDADRLPRWVNTNNEEQMENNNGAY